MYNVYEKDKKVIVEGIKDFNLDHIFDCGQCFRWIKESDDSYTGIAFEKTINIAFIPDSKNSFQGKIILTGSNISDYENIWKNYFDLERDYSNIKKAFSEKDSTMAKAITYGQGIRILQQDKWETLISFIISQNNNIPRIKKCIECICTSFGKKVGVFQGREFYSFPSAEVLSKLTQEDLAHCKLGYRSKYILETAKIIANDNSITLNSMGDASKDEAMKFLLSLCGVGPKVANCIMLFSMGKYDSFPIDVWVKRVMNKLYDIKEENTSEMLKYAEKHFGQYGGIAQQYLFYYIRQCEKM
ncbi:DNA-3-methyladenine glycosylase family protein [Anaerovorax odorimutans]|uniref:DNA-3-methyladenine glycosylase family protein n=1 Tax=Anaerovorax odorimutans TaxID=109327 RepID=UPI00041DA639|nr:DNA glycosylase [Anaerovorax odorimutans]